jgi:hypothetical protein
MVRNGIQTLASQYALEGMSGTAAVQRATTDILGRYSFIPNPNDSGVTMRVPAVLGGNVRSFAAQTLQNLKPTDLQPMPGTRNLTPQQAQQASLDAARGGVWVTAPDDQGLVLERRLSGGLGYTPVRRANGGMVELRFKDAPTAVAAAQPPDFTPGPVVTP